MMRHITPVLLLLLCVPLGLRAQSPPPAQASPSASASPHASPSATPPAGAESEAARKMREILAEEEKLSSGVRELGHSLLPEASSGLDQLDPATREQYNAAMREYYRYRINGYQHRTDIFRWQFFSSKIIFFVVILLVLSGVYFSGVQFHSALRRGRAPAPAAQDGAAQVLAVTQHEVTEIEASVKGIRVSSPVLGVLILVISFLFFYLYLIYVYPIVDTL